MRGEAAHLDVLTLDGHKTRLNVHRQVLWSTSLSIYQIETNPRPQSMIVRQNRLSRLQFTYGQVTYPH